MSQAAAVGTPANSGLLGLDINTCISKCNLSSVYFLFAIIFLLEKKNVKTNFNAIVFCYYQAFFSNYLTLHSSVMKSYFFKGKIKLLRPLP